MRAAANPSRRPKAGTSRAAATNRRRLFARAYIANGHNATRAAIEAGFSAKTARSQGQRLLTDVDVRRELAEVAERSCLAADLGVDRTLQELACIAYSDPRRLFGPDGRMKRLKELDAETAAALAHVDLDEDGRIISFRFLDKVAALGMAMKHLGLFERDNRQAGQSYALQVVLVGSKDDREPIGSPARQFRPGIEVVTHDPQHPDVGQETRAPHRR